MKPLVTAILLLSFAFSAKALDKGFVEKLGLSFDKIDWSKVKNTRLKYSKHLNSELIHDPKFKIYYLLHKSQWTYSYSPKKGIWEPVQSVPLSFTKIPKTDNYTSIHKTLKNFHEAGVSKAIHPPSPYFYESYFNIFTPPQILPYRRGDTSPLTQSFYSREFQVFQNSQFLFREWDSRLRALERQRSPLYRDRDFNRDNRINKQQDSLKRYYLDNLRRTQNGSSQRSRSSSYLPRR